MSIIPILLIFIIVFLVACIFYHRFCYFSNRSIPSPPIPSIIYGHLSDLLSVKSYSKQLQIWTRQYGSVYGIFEGTCPIYVVSDIKFIEEIFVTQFSRFPARRTTLGSRILGEEHSNVFTTNEAERWKKQRKTLNPTFSGAKMRRLLPTVEVCMNIFIERLKVMTKETALINIYEIYND